MVCLWILQHIPQLHLKTVNYEMEPVTSRKEEVVIIIRQHYLTIDLKSSKSFIIFSMERTKDTLTDIKLTM